MSQKKNEEILNDFIYIFEDNKTWKFNNLLEVLLALTTNSFIFESNKMFIRLEKILSKKCQEYIEKQFNHKELSIAFHRHSKRAYQTIKIKFN